MPNALTRLRALGHTLPNLNKKGGNYVTFTRHRDLIFAAGQTCLQNDVLQYKGVVDVDVSIQQAQKAAELCALNLLAIVNEAVGSLDNVKVLKVNGFIRCLPDFELQSRVLDGASTLFEQVLGPDRGGHARAAIGTNSLPRGAPVEVEAVFAVLP